MDTKSQKEREVYQTIPFTFEEQLIRVVYIDELVWFIAQDVGKVFGYKRITDYSFNFLEDETKVVFIKACGKNRKMLLLNLSGLNRLIFGTKNPLAESFNLWLLNKVLLTTTQINMYNTIKKLLTEADIYKELITKGHTSISKENKHLTEAEKIIIRDLRKDGLSFDKISLIMGRNKETVRHACKEADHE